MFGEGPTRITEGQFADNVRKEYTVSEFRFTTSQGALYVFSMKDAEDGKYTVHALGEQDASRVANFHGIIREIKLLGSSEPVAWTRDADGLYVSTIVLSDMPLVFKIIID